MFAMLISEGDGARDAGVRQSMGFLAGARDEQSQDETADQAGNQDHEQGFHGASS